MTQHVCRAAERLAANSIELSSSLTHQLQQVANQTTSTVPVPHSTDPHAPITSISEPGLDSTTPSLSTSNRHSASHAAHAASHSAAAGTSLDSGVAAAGNGNSPSSTAAAPADITQQQAQQQADEVQHPCLLRSVNTVPACLLSFVPVCVELLPSCLVSGLSYDGMCDMFWKGHLQKVWVCKLCFSD